jgi:hypothetical protein
LGAAWGIGVETGVGEGFFVGDGEVVGDGVGNMVRMGVDEGDGLEFEGFDWLGKLETYHNVEGAAIAETATKIRITTTTLEMADLEEIIAKSKSPSLTVV